MAILNSRPKIDLGEFRPVDAASDAANGTAAAVRDAADGTASAVRDAANGTASAMRDAANGTSAAVRDASDQAREGIDRVTELARDVAREVGKASSDVRFDDIVHRLRAAMPASTIRGVVTRLERELPDTDKDRYDRAYERGRVQTRSVFLGLGALVGIAAGVTAAILLDPQRGPARRARIAELKRDVARQAQERSKVVIDRARSMAEERGIGGQKSDVLDEIGEAATEAKAKARDVVDREMVPVMAADDAVESPIPPAFIADPTPVAHG